MSFTRADGGAPGVLFVSHDAYPHGAQYVLLSLAEWLKANGLVRPRFVLAGPGGLYEEFLRVGPVLRIDSSHLLRENLGRSARLLRSFCREDVAAVYLNSVASGHVVELTKNLDVPHVAHVHELEKSIQRFAGAERMAALRARADLFIAVSEPVAENLRVNHGVSDDRLRIVNAFIRCTGMRDLGPAEKRRAKAALGLDPEAKLVLGCGTTDWRKGPDIFVEVAALVRESYGRPFKFVWVGGATSQDETRELTRLVESHGLHADVSFVGEISTPLPYMVAADAFLLPSREDPFPLVCLEAADAGIPVVCFAEAGGMPGFVGSDAGSVVPYLDVRRMADALTSFLSDEARARRIGAQGRKKVRENFDVSVKGREIYEILSGLCPALDAGREGADASVLSEA